jgi:hypothetical protein
LIESLGLNDLKRHSPVLLPDAANRALGGNNWSTGKVALPINSA